jgi:hypothetical protein
MSKDNDGMMSAEETPDSSTIALWQSYQHSPSSKAEEIIEGNYDFGLTKYIFSCFEGILNML